MGATIAIGLVGIAGMIKSSSDASSAQKQASAQMQQTQQQEDTLLTQQKQQTQQATDVATRNTSLDNQRSLASAAAGRGSTLVTSPLGITTPPNTAGKTLLGQ